MDTRNKNRIWRTTETDEVATVNWNGAQLAVLMDIRDELQSLRGTVQCVNAVAIPTILRRIAKNTSIPEGYSRSIYRGWSR